MFGTAKKKGSGPSKSRLASASAFAVESMEARVFLSTTPFTVAQTLRQGNYETYEATGPYQPSGYLAIAGQTGRTGTGLYTDFAAIDFPNVTTGSTVSDVTNLTINLDNSAAAGTTGFAAVAGNFNVYLATDTTDALNTGGSFDTGTSDGVDATNSFGASTQLLGTVSFSGATGFNALSLTLTPGSAASNELAAALNAAGSKLRLVIAPVDGAAADFYGVYSPDDANISIAGDATAANEQFNIGTAAANGVTVAQNTVTSGVMIDVTRFGPNSDAATLNYKTTAGTASDGGQYTGTQAGTVTFAAGQSQTTILVPISNATPFAGTKTFTVTLTGATPATYTGAIGSTASTTVTIVGSAVPTGSAPNTGNAATVSDIEGGSSSTANYTGSTGGYYGTAYAPMNGADTNYNGGGSFYYLSYEVIEATPTITSAIYPISGQSVTSVSGLSFTFYNTATSGSYLPHSGEMNVYLLTTPESSAPTSGTGGLEYKYTFDSSGVDGVAGQAGAQLLGALSFNGTYLGYDSYALPLTSAEESLIQGYLNAGTPIRLAVAPGSPYFAADFGGSNHVPAITVDDTVQVNKTTEAIAFQRATYTESEAGPAVQITLTRTGSNVSDTATVDVSTSDGSALAGTNYAALNDFPVTFAAGSTTSAPFTIPAIDVQPMGGNKFLRLTLSNAATDGTQPTTAVLGAQSAASLTITDTSTAPTELLSPGVDGVADVEVDGIYDDTEFKATAKGGTGAPYASFGVADFNLSDAATGPTAPTNPVTGIDSATLTGTLDTAEAAAAGTVNIYLVSNSTSSIAVLSPESKANGFYDATQGVEGLGSQFGSAVLLGTYAVPVNQDSAVTIPLGFSAAGETALINALNNPNNDFRIVMTPEDSNVVLDLLGPSLALNIEAQEGAAAPALPDWVQISTGANVTWDSSTETLTVDSGTATIVKDPDPFEAVGIDPVISASGASSHVVVQLTTPSGDGDLIHLGGVQLLGGATMDVASLGAARSHNNHEVLVVGASAETADPIFSIQSIDGSKLDMEDNDLIVHSAASDAGGKALFSTVQGLTAQGRQAPTGFLDGTWTGNGLTSSQAASVDAAAGYEQNVLAPVLNGDQILGQDSAWTVGAASEPLGGADSIVKYTYNGDAALEGYVGDDSVTIVNGLYDGGVTQQNDWAFGSFTNSGTVDDDDVSIISGLYGNGLPGSGLPLL